MSHRNISVRVHPDLCRRIARLHSGSRTPVQKLVHAILRDACDETAVTQSCRARNAQKRSWRYR
jgi:hypothetical protein